MICQNNLSREFILPLYNYHAVQQSYKPLARQALLEDLYEKLLGVTEP